MGTYTQIASLYRPRAGSRGGQGVLRERTEATTTAPFVCPVCDDGSVAEALCERCQVPTVATEGLLRLGRRAKTRGGSLRLVVPLLMALTALVTLGVFGLRALPLFPVLLLAALASALAPRLGPALLSRLPSARPLPSLRELPDRASSPVRVRARVVGLDEGGLLLQGDEGRCLVRAPEDARVYVEGRPTTVLHVGDEVEVCGIGERGYGAGDGYRDSRGSFSFTEQVQLVRCAPAAGS